MSKQTGKTQETKKANPAAVAALKAQLGGQLVGHHIKTGDLSPDLLGEKPVNYVFASNGIFRVVKNEIGIFSTKEADLPKDFDIPGLQPVEEGPELLIPKIPFKYWLQILSWYKDVHTKDATEASVLFFWNHNQVQLPVKYETGREVKGVTEDGQLIIYCPEQKNSSALSNFGADGMVNWLRENTTPLCETHSHHTMGAFWSSTDNANENMTQFYGVYGKIKTDEPAFLFRFVSGNHKIDIDPSILFDYPTVKTTVEMKTTTTTEFVGAEGLDIEFETKTEEEDHSDVFEDVYTGPWPDVQYPEDWFAQHTKNYATSVYPKGPANKNYSYDKKTGPASETSHWDHYDDYYGLYGYDGYGGAQRSPHSTSAQTSKSKKKDLKNASDDVSETVETSSSVVEILATQVIDQLGADEIKQLIEELCEFGYDYIITDIVKEQGGYKYGYI